MRRLAQAKCSCHVEQILRLVKRILNQIDPPVGAADDLRDRAYGVDLLDMAQGAPAYPTAPAIVERVGDVARHPEGARYTRGRGLAALRFALAADLTEDYEGEVTEENVLITAGSNQAFCLTTSSLAEAGDEILITVPFYFNHDMWIRLDQLRPVYVEASPLTGQMSVSLIAQSITSRTRMIVVTSPGNPTGITAHPDFVDELADFAHSKRLVLVLDETYRMFRARPGPAHRLFQRPDWPEYFVSLQSFSKDFALPGYRVGAVIASSNLLDELIKLMDCVAICAPRIGQEAALEGLRSAREWRKDRVHEISVKHERFLATMSPSPSGFQLKSSGGFYGWLRHPGATSDTEEVVRRLALECGVLVMSGKAFTPNDTGFIRVSFANLSLDEIDEFGRRLQMF